MESLEWRVKKLENKILGQTASVAYLDRLMSQDNEQESICDQLSSVAKLYRSYLDNAGKNYLNFVESYGSAKKLLGELGDSHESSSASKVELVLAYEEDLVKYMKNLKSMAERANHVLNIERWPNLNGLTERLNKLEQNLMGHTDPEAEKIDQEVFERIMLYKKNLDTLRGLEITWNKRLEHYENAERDTEEDD